MAGAAVVWRDSIADGEPRPGQKVVSPRVQAHPGPNVDLNILGDEINKPAHGVVSRAGPLTGSSDRVERVPLNESLETSGHAKNPG